MNKSEIEHSKSEISIEQIRPEHTWRLRQQVLYPQSKLAEMKMDEDENGLHFAAFKDNYIVAVVSLFPNGDDYQFRKFAVDERVQGTGIGRELLNYITDFTALNGGKRLWCNARVSAIGFYLKAGFTHTGKLFSKHGFDYEILEKVISDISV
jgi:phosphoribosylformimino-5-aminoimidazole carboxamide ribotide isomerase